MKTLLNTAVDLTQALVLVLAAAMLLVPGVSSPAVHTVLLCLYVAGGLVSTWRAYRAGYLTMTPGRLIAAHPRMGKLETTAFLIGGAALIFA